MNSASPGRSSNPNHTDRTDNTDEKWLTVFRVIGVIRGFFRRVAIFISSSLVFRDEGRTHHIVNQGSLP
jgi:hypothetical protein